MVNEAASQILFQSNWVMPLDPLNLPCLPPPPQNPIPTDHFQMDSGVRKAFNVLFRKVTAGLTFNRQSGNAEGTNNARPFPRPHPEFGTLSSKGPN